LLRQHDRANNFVLESAVTDVAGGGFEARLRLPPSLPWARLTLRVYVATDREDGLAVLSLPVSKR